MLILKKRGSDPEFEEEKTPDPDHANMSRIRPSPADHWIPPPAAPVSEEQSRRCGRKVQNPPEAKQKCCCTPKRTYTD